MERINTTQEHHMDMPNPSDVYLVIDFRTGRVVYTTTWANRNRARRVAERRNQAYGAYRFGCSLSTATPQDTP